MTRTLSCANGKALGDQLRQMKHRLRRDVHGQAIAVEARHRGMRLEAGMLLRAVRNVASNSSGSRVSRALGDPVARLLGLLRERRRGSAQIALPWRGPPAPSETLPAFLRSPCRTRPAHRGLRASSSPITAGIDWLDSFIASIAASAVLRSFAATAAIGAPTSARCRRRRAARPQRQRPARRARAQGRAR